jgi:hypothetical protein
MVRVRTRARDRATPSMRPAPAHDPKHNASTDGRSPDANRLLDASGCPSGRSIEDPPEWISLRNFFRFLHPKGGADLLHPKGRGSASGRLKIFYFLILDSPVVCARCLAFGDGELPCGELCRRASTRLCTLAAWKRCLATVILFVEAVFTTLHSMTAGRRRHPPRRLEQATINLRGRAIRGMQLRELWSWSVDGCGRVERSVLDEFCFLYSSIQHAI